MTSDLRRELGGALPDGLDALDAGEAAALAELVARAKRRQAQDCDAAVDKGLAFLPRLVRATVKRALFR